MKKCKECGELKELDEFYNSWATKDRRGSKCKECLKKYANKHRAENIESARDYDNERSRLPHRKALNKSVVTNYRKNNPERYYAHNAVNNAVRDNRLKKPNYCTRCGKGGIIHGHHHDYSKPLEVEWLCVVCHSQERGKPEAKEIVYRQPIFMQMELFEPQGTYSTV